MKSDSIFLHAVLFFLVAISFNAVAGNSEGYSAKQPDKLVGAVCGYAMGIIWLRVSEAITNKLYYWDTSIAGILKRQPHAKPLKRRGSRLRLHTLSNTAIGRLSMPAALYRLFQFHCLKPVGLHYRGLLSPNTLQPKLSGLISWIQQPLRLRSTGILKIPLG